ncbi:hypothetical protein [Streptomyces sp. MBT27]|uniref:hypothetical protein n=1 Tax=Streptomyces sp. MBT27 TaxID=1488356 RepID=UPI001421D654|nr:hypothetical protein [Streptomyces sp. MBT27]
MATAVAPALDSLAPVLSLDEINKLASDGPAALRITITPELATGLLRQNRKNRNLRETTVASYMRDIRAKTWPLNGETIKIACTGDVLDGQHRLYAIERARIPVETFIVIGLPPETQATMDAGMRRTVADALGLDDEPNATSLAAILRRVWAWEQGDRRFNSRNSPTTAECQRLLMRHPELRRSAEIAVRTRAAFPHISQSALGTAHYLFNAISTAETAWFFQRVADGAELSVGHPVLALRNRLTSDRAKEGSIPWDRQLAYLIHTWNSVRTDRTLTRLQVKAGSRVPEPK